MLHGLFRRLFGGDEPAGEPAATEDYGDYVITATPVQEGAGWRVAGRIATGRSENARTCEFVRADTSPNRDDIIDITLRKARQLIDEQGEALFRDDG